MATYMVVMMTTTACVCACWHAAGRTDTTLFETAANGDDDNCMRWVLADCASCLGLLKSNGDDDSCMRACMLLRSRWDRLHKKSETIAAAAAAAAAAADDDDGDNDDDVDDDDDDGEDDDVPACCCAAGQWFGCRHANSSAASPLHAVRSA